MGIFSRATLSLVAATGLTLLTGCGGSDDEGPDERGDQPLVLRPAPATPGTPINLDLPRDREVAGAFAFNRWPKACDLLTDREIKAVLPQAVTVGREPADQGFAIRDPDVEELLGSPPAGVPGYETADVTVEGAECTYKLDLPSAGLRGDGGKAGVEILVTVDAVGTRGFVKENTYVDVDLGKDEYPVEVPSGRCQADTALGVACRKGRVGFTIKGEVDRQTIDAASVWTTRYRVNGKTTTFSADFDDANPKTEFRETDREDKFLRGALDAELAKIVLAKL